MERRTVTGIEAEVCARNLDDCLSVLYEPLLGSTAVTVEAVQSEPDAWRASNYMLTSVQGFRWPWYHP